MRFIQNKMKWISKVSIGYRFLHQCSTLHAFHLCAFTRTHSHIPLRIRIPKDYFFTTSINFDLNTIKHTLNKVYVSKKDEQRIQFRNFFASKSHVVSVFISSSLCLCLCISIWHFDLCVDSSFVIFSLMNLPFLVLFL